MALFNSRTGNPALSQKVFDSHPVVAGQPAMTFSGTINKFIFLFVMLAGASFYSWNVFSRGGDIGPLLGVGIIGGLVVAVIICIKMEWAQYLAPAYAILEGFFLGTVSAALNNAFKVKAPFLIMQAVLLTFGVVLAMLALYKSGVIKVTKRYLMVVIGATAGIFVFYLLTLLLGLFHIQIPFVFQGGAIGIIFSLVVVTIAALNLAIDFAMIDQGSQTGAPKYFEWYCAFGLMVTIIWLYIEILRLLTKIYSSR